MNLVTHLFGYNIGKKKSKGTKTFNIYIFKKQTNYLLVEEADEQRERDHIKRGSVSFSRHEIFREI